MRTGAARTLITTHVRPAYFQSCLLATASCFRQRAYPFVCRIRRYDVDGNKLQCCLQLLQAAIILVPGLNRYTNWCGPCRCERNRTTAMRSYYKRKADEERLKDQVLPPPLDSCEPLPYMRSRQGCHAMEEQTV